ncbi:MAG: RHS repeat-associated core domain-containing protein [Terracidiphilus sp.]
MTNETIGADPEHNNGSVAYGLDPVGNRLTENSSLPGISSGSFGYNADDEVSSESYDLNGNTIAAGGKAFTYDAENHLTGMSASGTTVSIVYDAFGNRVAKTVNGVTTRYLVEDDVNPTGLPQVMEEIVGGAVDRVYAYGLQRISEDQIVNNAWAPSFYGYDGAGSVRQLTNAAGIVTDTYEYDAFGNKVNSTGPTPNNYLYRGEQYDPDLSLYYLRARYMNPVTGRFLSRDPRPGHIAIPRSLHKYLYTSDDPVNRIDPRGKADLEEEELEAPESETAAETEKALGGRINCILTAAGDAFGAWSAIESGDLLASGGAVVSLAADWESCSGEAEGAGCCFAAGTPVHTNHGNVPVEKVEVGDEVVSRNRETGKLGSQPVTALTPLHKDGLLEMRIEGERTPLRPSADHPFWVTRGAAGPAWIESGRMRVGDLLETTQGNWRRVVAITPLPGQETVYNFTVDLNHDYFVGETGFLVHNANCPCHGNTLGDQPTTLYGLPDLENPESDLPAKWGITSNPLGERYSGPYLESVGAGDPIPLMTGPRWKMAQIERELTSRWPGRLNKEPWRGCLIGMP